MPVPRYRVMIRSADYVVVDELTDWATLTLIKRFNRTGTWTLELHPDSVSAPLFAPNSGIVVYRDDEIIFSGQMAGDIIRTHQTLTVAGFDDNVLLEEPARPTPTNPSGPYPDAYDVRTGQASTVIYDYVGYNWWPMGLHRPSDGAPVPINFIDPHLGATLTGRANFQSVQALCRELAATPQAGGLAFDLIQHPSDPRALEFRQWLPVDRTATAKFGVELGTARDFEDSTGLPSANYWIVLGGGFGAARVIVEDGDDAAIAATGRRVTGVYDARGISDVGELNQKLAELLAGAVTTQKTTIVPFEVPSLEFGTDWDFGDVVTVVVDGVEHREVVREVQIELSPEFGARITPMVGDAGSSNDDLVTQHLRVVQERLSNVERNWSIPDDSIIAPMLQANAVTEPKLDALDAPADNEILTYDAASARLEWQGFAALATLAGNLSITSLTTTGAITAGTTITAGGNVQGARLLSTVGTGTPPLQVSSSTVVNNLNANYLEGHGAGDFVLDGELSAALGGYLPTAGGTISGGLTVQGALAVDGNTVLGNSGSDTVTMPGDLSVNDVVASGSVTAQGLTSSSGLTLSGPSNIDGNGGTAGQLRIGTVLANAANPFGSERLRVGGPSRLEGGVTVTSGGIGVTGSSAFNSGVSIANGLTITSGGLSVAGAVTWGDSSTAGFAFASPSSALIRVTIAGTVYRIPCFV